MKDEENKEKNKYFEQILEIRRIIHIFCAVYLIFFRL
jgi:hypothetical protein